ncbi:lactoylglutathione lyase [Alteromonas lipolytica]|uniref:Lactoylglutathione lyase n=1 Tax=Alteromonas lipolytica TaxID=1856405 RepID=A0A1E8FIL9_9ALTE|nr:lactoylglutathione lyase [Alteromonas lipolytica]OFI35734.1 lactoylglutathione lyase [Alteromonas lipolytica]GGF80326.1 glyoxalase [Alteromonas lipolytica]
MDVVDIKAFVPSKDYAISTAFYTEIGFVPSPVSDDLTLFQNGDCLFFLQRFYNPSLAQNFMLQICVQDIDSAYQQCLQSVHKTKISSLQEESWGRVFYLWGPAGELLHITQLPDHD